MPSTTVMNAYQLEAALITMAREISSPLTDTTDLCLVGIRTGGAFLAQRLKDRIEAEVKSEIPTGIIDITLYRDDWTIIGPKPIVGKTELPFSIDDKRLVLIDDVLFTGRTVRAAMDALMDFGRPAKIELAVLVDRGHRELPICSNYTGIVLKTSRAQRVNVYLTEKHPADEVVIEDGN